MRILRFTLYYLKLRISSSLGTNPHHGPLGLKWRWQTWHRLRRAERKYKAAGTVAQLRSDLARLWRMIFS
ncbi:MAG: hypothetical protein IT174_05035 [Acidobacteria bacterium]|nr:hypothetical protein [Acidobacteriota bacterium]